MIFGVGKWFLFTAGVLLLAFAGPKSWPWTMRNLSVCDRVSDVLCLLVVLVVPGLTVLFASGRRVIRFLRDHPRRAFRFGTGGMLFLVTLVSLSGIEPVGLTLEEPPFLLYSARPLVLGVVLGGLSVLLMLPALSCVVKKTGTWILWFGSVPGPRLFMLIVFTVFFFLANVLSWCLFEHIPHVQDCVTQLFHSRVLSAGRVTVPSHMYYTFFDFGHMINNGFFYSMYPFGHMVWLAAGSYLHVPWLVNPFLGALTAVLFYCLGKGMYNERIGRVAATLGCLSPFMLFMSAEFMSHVSTLFCLVLFMLGYVNTIERGGKGWAILAGASIGWALNTRLLTGIGIGLPFGVHAVSLLFSAGGFRRYAVRLSVMAGVAVCFGFLMLAFNYATTGDPFVVGYEVIWGKSHHPGFGESIDGIVHTPRAGLEHLLANLNALNKYLFEWPVPGLIFMFIPVGLASKNRWDRLLMASFWCLALVYFFYWFNDWCFGPRFMYEASGAMILLTARGLYLLPRLLRGIFGVRSSRYRVCCFAAGTVCFLTVCGWSLNVPSLVRLYADDYWCVNRDVINCVEERGISNAVVYVRSYYACVFPENVPSLDGDVLYVKDLREKNRLFMSLYPERKHYGAYGPEIWEIPVDRPGVVMGMERTPFFRAVADRLGWSYHEIWLKPWALIEMDPEHPKADGILLNGHTHAWEPNPVEQWGAAMLLRAQSSVLSNDWNTARQTVDRLLSIWPEYVPGLQVGLSIAEHTGDNPRAAERQERLNYYMPPVLQTNVVFRNGIVLRGWRVESGDCSSGGQVTLVLYWHIPRAVMMRNWAVNLKLKDAEGRTCASNDSILGSDVEHTRQTDQEDYVEVRQMNFPEEKLKGPYTIHISLRDGNPPFRRLVIPGKIPGTGCYEKEYPFPSDIQVR